MYVVSCFARAQTSAAPARRWRAVLLCGLSMENVGQNTLLQVPTVRLRRRISSTRAVTVLVLPDLRMPTTVMILTAAPSFFAETVCF